MLPSTEPMIEALATLDQARAHRQDDDDQLGRVAEGRVQQRGEARAERARRPARSPRRARRRAPSTATPAATKTTAPAGADCSQRRARRRERRRDAERDEVAAREAAASRRCAGRHARDPILPEAHAHPAHQRRRRRLAAPGRARGRAATRSATVDVVAPATDMTGVSRSISLAAPIAVDEVELPGRPRGVRRRRHAGRLRALRGARARRRAARPRRLGPEPRHQPRRRRRLLRHRRGRARGRAARAARGRALAAGQRRRQLLRRRGLCDASRCGSCRCSPRAPCRPARHQRERAGRARPPACASRGSAAAATGPHCARRAEAEGGRRHYRLYGSGPLRLEGEPGTDIAAVAEGYISLTPLRFDLFAEDALAPLDGAPAGVRAGLLDRPLRPRRHADRHDAADRRLAPARARDGARRELPEDELREGIGRPLLEQMRDVRRAARAGALRRLPRVQPPRPRRAT